MAVVGYARVSSSDQDLSIQVEQLTDAGCTKIFSEKRSGTVISGREELERAMNYVREGDTFVVTRIDRMARSVSDFYKLITDLQERGVGFRCLLQPIDTTNSTGKLTMGILACVAEFDNEVRKERQREGIARAMAEGKYRGHPKRGRTPQKWTAAKEMLKEGHTYERVSLATGISYAQIRRRIPGYGKKGNAKRAKLALEAVTLQEAPKPSTPSAAEAVESQPTPEPAANKPGLFRGLFKG